MGKSTNHKETSNVLVVSVQSRLCRIVFDQTNLTGVCFQGAQLQGAIFKEVNLTEADFTGAFLEGAIFINANLIKTNLTGTSLQRTLFKNVNFETIQGFDCSNRKGALIY